MTTPLPRPSGLGAARAVSADGTPPAWAGAFLDTAESLATVEIAAAAHRGGETLSRAVRHPAGIPDLGRVRWLGDAVAVHLHQSQERAVHPIIRTALEDRAGLFAGLTDLAAPYQASPERVALGHHDAQDAQSGRPVKHEQESLMIT